MTDITDKDSFDAVPLLDVGDEVKGGIEGSSNKQGIALANRTRYLYNGLETQTNRLDNLQTGDVGNFDSDVQTLLDETFVPGTGITIGRDPNTGKVTIATNLTRDGSASFVAVEREGSIANQSHSFEFSPITEFLYNAYALLKETGSVNQTVVIETFDKSNIDKYTVTDDVIFNGSLVLYRGENINTVSVGSLFTADFRHTGKDITLGVTGSVTIIPKMTSSSTSGYTASASTYYSANYAPYKAFDQINTNGVSDCWASGKGNVPTTANPQWIRIDLPAAVNITAYSLQNRYAGEIANPTKWKLQGSVDKTTWEDIGALVSDEDATPGKIKTYSAYPSKAYSSYRLLISDFHQTLSTTDFVAIQEFGLYVGNKMMFLASDGTTAYAPDGNGGLTQYSNVTTSNIDNSGFSNLSGITPELLQGKDITQLVTSKATTITIDSLPDTQTIIPKTLINTGDWKSVNKVVPSVTQTGTNSDIRFAITMDLTVYYAWTSDENYTGFKVIGGINGPLDITEGNTLTEIMNIPKDDWMTLFNNGGLPKDFNFAYGVFLNNRDSSITVETQSLVVDNRDAWLLTNPNQCEIRWRNTGISFKTITAGDYIFGYMMP